MWSVKCACLRLHHFSIFGQPWVNQADSAASPTLFSIQLQQYVATNSMNNEILTIPGFCAARNAAFTDDVGLSFTFHRRWVLTFPNDLADSSIYDTMNLANDWMIISDGPLSTDHQWDVNELRKKKKAPVATFYFSLFSPKRPFAFFKSSRRKWIRKIH